MKNFIKNLFKSEPRRRGIVEFEATGGGLINNEVDYHVVVEIREIETSGGMTKIDVEDISGAPSHLVRRHIASWVPTNKIKWID